MALFAGLLALALLQVQGDVEAGLKLVGVGPRPALWSSGRA